MTASASARPVSRLEVARQELVAAKAEHATAFKAGGFDPARADRAQSRLEAAQAAFEGEIDWARGQNQRHAHEARIASLIDRLAFAERTLRGLEYKLHNALRSLGLPAENDAAWLERQLEETRGYCDRGLACKGLKAGKKRRFEARRAAVAEAEYRLEPVARKREQIESLRADLALLQGSQQAAK